MAWYREAERELTEVATAVQSQRPLRLAPLQSLAGSLVAALTRNDELVVEALSSPAGFPLITNLLNVAILGTKVGIGLGYYGQELERLALAGLVHDIGLFAVPQSLVTKSGRLTQDERMLIEQHPELGYRLIQKVGDDYQWLAHIVRQAHERSNGQGYPNRLKGRQISETAQILGVVDVFDALVSERPYRRRMLPHEAVKELLVNERATFPREILKALVQQLSVFPLGTTVRLTTGEVGTVVRVNSRYPLRPVVRVTEAAGLEGGTRQVDLSLTPLVSVVQTLESPMVGRVEFSDVAEERAVAPIGAVSDNFTSLLESLDAIATAIQGVVETRIASLKVPPPSSPQASNASPVGERTDQSFRNEIVGLFALEAREWLSQIQTAIQKLGAGGDNELRGKLYGFVLNGVSNLARSAATVQLGDIEAMATNLLPILRDVGSARQDVIDEALRSLQTGLDRIAMAVHRLAEGGISDKQDREERGPLEATPQATCHTAHSPHGAVQVSDAMSERIEKSMPLLTALRELQQARARSVQPARDVLEAVLQRAEQESEDREHIDGGTIVRILSDLDRLDDAFLRELRERVPAMTAAIRRVREAEIADFVTASQLDPVLTHVEALCVAAKTVQASTIMMFLQGLKAFLSVNAYRKESTLPQRLEAVEERLNALIPMAEQWVTLGRLERAAIAEILPT